MKKIFIPFVIAATTLSFAACQKEVFSPAIEDELVSLNFTSTNPTTKTVADAVNKTILWEKGDKISIAYTVNDKWQNANGDATADRPAKIYASNGLAAGGETAVFNISGNFNATATGVHQFYSVYPSSCVKSTDIKYAPSVTMTIPDVQTPAENSFDAAADLMIGKATKTYNSLSEAKADEIPLLWQRIVSHADITLKGLQGLTENEVITTIVLTADADAKLVGDRWIDIQNGNILGPKNITDANILTINGTNLKVNSNNVEFWAAVMPATVKSLNIVVETNKATYTRNIESCNIEFKQNARKGLNVDMSSAERVEKSVGLALPFVDDFSWSTTAKTETDFSNNIKEKSNNKYTEAYRLYTPKSDGEIRIGTSNKEPGYISTCALDLSKDFHVEVEAKAYNVNDNAHISISVDNGTQLIAKDALTKDYETYCFNLSAATASSSIKISTDTKRAVITSIKIAEGKSTYVPAPKLTISPEFLKVASDATNTMFAVTSNTKWTVSTTSDWAKVSTPSGENNGDVEITFSENTTDKERTADIVVTTEDSSITKTFALTQKSVTSTAGPIVLYTLNPVKGKNSNYANSGDVEINGITWSVGGNNMTIPWRIGGKNITKVDRALYSKTAFPKALTSIKVTFGTSNITVNSCKLVYSTNADFTDSKECNIQFTASSTVEVTDNFPANAYYKLVFNVTNTTNSNKSVQLSKIEFLGLDN